MTGTSYDGHAPTSTRARPVHTQARPVHNPVITSMVPAITDVEVSHLTWRCPHLTSDMEVSHLTSDRTHNPDISDTRYPTP